MIRAARKFWAEIRAWVEAQERAPRITLLRSRWGSVRFVRAADGRICRVRGRKLKTLTRSSGIYP